MARGFTLVELAVSLAVLAVATGLVGVAVTRSLEESAEPLIAERVALAQRAALRSGHAVVLRLDGAERVVLWPDGSATPTRVSYDGESWIVDAWTGEVSRVTQ
jgi:prepilin-type N-terminal cleavage/methylation domain-containing protein